MFDKIDNEADYFKRIIYFDYFCRVLNPDKDNYDADDGNLSIIIWQKFHSNESGVVWDASLMLAKYIEYHYYRTKDDKSMRNTNIIELGSGTGFLGIWCATMGASVLMTDLENSIPLIEKNSNENSSLILNMNDNRRLIKIDTFDWSDRTKYHWNFLNWKTLNEIDLILISDCIYYQQGMLSLFHFIEWIFEQLSFHKSINDNEIAHLKILISYEDRDDKTSIVNEFFQKLKQINHLKCGKIPNRELHPEYQFHDLHLFELTYV